jgi:hypothetical protein
MRLKSWKKKLSFPKEKFFFEMWAPENIAAYLDRDKWLSDQSKRARLLLI